jgi:hypothetical protein
MLLRRVGGSEVSCLVRFATGLVCGVAGAVGERLGARRPDEAGGGSGGGTGREATKVSRLARRSPALNLIEPDPAVPNVEWSSSVD